MSWHFSQALVAAFSAENSSAGALFAQSSGNRTPRVYLSSDRMTAFSRLSRFGMTFAPLTEAAGEAVLMWFLAAFPARTYPVQARAQESTESAAECGRTWPESLAKYDPSTSSWKTPQLSLFEVGQESLEILPDWGMTHDGELWALDQSVAQWNESGFGLPAPTKSMASRGWGIGKKQRYGKQLEENARSFGYKPHPSVLEWSMGWILTWTRLQPLETDKFRQWQLSHGGL